VPGTGRRLAKRILDATADGAIGVMAPDVARIGGHRRPRVRVADEVATELGGVQVGDRDVVVGDRPAARVMRQNLDVLDPTAELARDRQVPGQERRDRQLVHSGRKPGSPVGFRSPSDLLGTCFHFGFLEPRLDSKAHGDGSSFEGLLVVKSG